MTDEADSSGLIGVLAGWAACFGERHACLRAVKGVIVIRGVIWGQDIRVLWATL